MKRSALKQHTSLKSKTGFKPSTKPMNRGTSVLKRTPFKNTGSTLARTGTLATNSTFKQGEGLKSKKPMKRVSEEQKVRNAVYYFLKPLYLKTHPICQFSGCEQPAVDLHHMAGRDGFNMFRCFMGGCREHHDAGHANTRLMREQGYWGRGHVDDISPRKELEMSDIDYVGDAERVQKVFDRITKRLEDARKL